MVAAAAGSASEPSGLHNLFTALEKQLGLKLVKVKNGFPLDTLVIDHANGFPRKTETGPQDQFGGREPIDPSTRMGCGLPQRSAHHDSVGPSAAPIQQARSFR